MSRFIHKKIVKPKLLQWQGDMNLSSRLVWLRISMRLIESGYFWRVRGVPLHSNEKKKGQMEFSSLVTNLFCQ